MALTIATERAFKLVEQATGLPVHVQPDASLPKNILAKVTPARGRTPFHQVAYHPTASAAPDYLIVYQCGFILRQFAVTESRFDLIATDAARSTVLQWIKSSPKSSNVPESSVDGLADFLFNGILSQLRSMPVGLRVDDWILHEFPELAALQRQAVMRQFDDNAVALRPDIQAAMPDEALRANIGMSAAFAVFWADRLSQPQVLLPYQATGHLAHGQALLDAWQRVPNDPAHDMQLIDTWADDLGISDWYSWVPLEGR